MLYDGSGCFRFRFRAYPSNVVSALTPSDPLCIEDQYEYQIMSQPPPSLPIGMPLSTVAKKTGVQFTVQITLKNPFNSMWTSAKIASARIAIASQSQDEGDAILDFNTSG